jgi:hypothetical protein
MHVGVPSEGGGVDPGSGQTPGTGVDGLELGQTPELGLVGSGFGHDPELGEDGSELGHSPLTGEDGLEFGQTPLTGPVDGFRFGQAGAAGGGILDGGCGAGVPATQLHDWPLLHTPLKPDGQPSLQLIPQPPQLYASVFKLTQRLSQASLAPPWPAHRTQAPPVHTLSLAHVFPHAPQFEGSFCVS